MCTCPYITWTYDFLKLQVNKKENLHILVTCQKWQSIHECIIFTFVCFKQIPDLSFHRTVFLIKKNVFKAFNLDFKTYVQLWSQAGILKSYKTSTKLKYPRLKSFIALTTFILILQRKKHQCLFNLSLIIKYVYFNTA